LLVTLPNICPFFQIGIDTRSLGQVSTLEAL